MAPPLSKQFRPILQKFWIWVIPALLFFPALWLRQEPASRAPIDTNAAYYMLSRSIAQDEGMVYADEAYARTSHTRKPPLLPYALSRFENPTEFLLYQALLSALLVFPIFGLGWRWHSRAAGVLAAGLWTFWKPSVAAACSLRPETMHALFFLIALLCLPTVRRGHRWPWMLPAGLCFGLAELTRPVLTLFLALLLGEWALQLRNPAKRRRVAASLTALVICFSTPLLIYQMMQKKHGFSYIYDRKGFMMLMAVLDEGETAPHGIGWSYLDEHKPENWDSLTDAARNRFVLKLTWQVVQEHPRRTIKNIGKRIFTFWFGRFGERSIKVESAGLSPWLIEPHALLTLLVLLGVVFSFSGNPPIFRYSLYFFLNFSAMAAVIHTRQIFREVVTPWFLALAGIGLIEGWRRLRKMRTGRSSQSGEEAPGKF